MCSSGQLCKKKEKIRIAPFDVRIGMWPNSSIANRMVVCKTHCANALPRKSPHHRLRLNHFPKNLSYGFRTWYHLWQQLFKKRSKSLFRGHYNRFWQSSMHVCDQRPRVRLDIASRSLILIIKFLLVFLHECPQILDFCTSAREETPILFSWRFQILDSGKRTF